MSILQEDPDDNAGERGIRPEDSGYADDLSACGIFVVAIAIGIASWLNGL